MMQGSQTVQVAREGIHREATVSWSHAYPVWTVTIRSDGFGTMQVSADDAFEALCLIREELEPLGWHIGVAGALPNVWPSGMARDQGGGLRAYRLTPQGAGDLVDTFAPIDPGMTVTIAEQRAQADRFFERPHGRS
ncbi:MULTISPECIES: hypothetical protein [unclassified Microbacterium]|uniref:hypothetical protein n=1 Tax=unclassified Microbacterium TaxID=2609290 RepID=UPI001E63B7B2|nr:hypothetical protein [Microbacterium sp. Bi121]